MLYGQKHYQKHKNAFGHFSISLWVFFFFIIVFIGEKIIKDLMLRFNFTQFYFYTYFVRWTK